MAEIRIALPDDPMEALREIAGYLRTVDMTMGRAVAEFEHDGDTVTRLACVAHNDPRLLGYWQMREWLEGLIEIVEEIDRIRAKEVRPC